MIQVYDNVDLFVGGLAESPLPNSKVGATFACIIAKTFTALRDGDCFFYESTDADTNALSVQQRHAPQVKVNTRDLRARNSGLLNQESVKLDFLDICVVTYDVRKGGLFVDF